MRFIKNPNYLLGIPNLIPEWKKMFSRKYLVNDLFSGVTVAFLAIPLSLAIALASGVPPAVGLITAIVAGVVCGFFGGTPLAVSGPAAAMSVLLADTVERFGLEGLVFMGLIAGLMQLISGVAGFGKLARYVPLPVVAGFTAGIGAIIIVGQIPRAFGLEPPDESHIINVFSSLKLYFNEINGDNLLLVVITILIIRGLPKILPRIQPILPAVAVATAFVLFFNLKVPMIGTIPNSLPPLRLPAMPGNISWSELLMGSFTIYLLASLETLLSSSAIDKLTNGKKHNSDQELIGQGLGNIAVSLFGGVPVTGVIARSAVNVKSGAKTRRSSIIHSFGVLLAVFAFAPYIAMVPIAALTGVLFSVAFSMLNFKEFHELWVTSRAEALIYAVTFITIISVDLIAGVQAGIIAAAIIVLFKATKSRLHISKSSYDQIIRLSLTGALTFLSTAKISSLEKELESVQDGQTVLLDLSSLNNLDTSGSSVIIDLAKHCQEKNLRFFITGLARRFEPLFKVSGNESFIDDHYLISEHELRKEESTTKGKSSYGQLVHGFNRFHEDRIKNDKRLFDYIVKKQNPHTLFITCSDSRVVPTEMTSSNPGDLFIIRNVGNFIPPYDQSETVCHSESAGLEFPLSALDITDIVICGHANCGAIKACKNYQPNVLPPKLNQWIKMIRSQLTFDNSHKLNQILRMNILNQIENLKTYPIVQRKLAQGTLTIHGWFFNFDQSMVYAWDEKKKQFEALIKVHQEEELMSGFNMF